MPGLNFLLVLAAMLFAIGALAAGLAGLSGVGIFLVPLFFYTLQTLGYGSPQLMQICLATSLASIIATFLRSVPSSLIVGSCAALMAIGTRSFGVPRMRRRGGPIHRAGAIAAGFGAAIVVPSVIASLLLSISLDGRSPLAIGAVNLSALALTIAMTLITAPSGVWLAHRMDAKRLTRVCGAVRVLIAPNMPRKAVG